jgi:hypothetical protein
MEFLSFYEYLVKLDASFFKIAIHTIASYFLFWKATKLDSLMTMCPLWRQNHAP